MMPGPIGLLGGLEHYEPTLPIDRRMLDEVGVFAPEVVILPLASFKSQAAAAGALAQPIGPVWARGHVRQSRLRRRSDRWRWCRRPTSSSFPEVCPTG